MRQATGQAEPVPAGLSVLLSISDDGRGFDPVQVRPKGLGLGIMDERAQAIGASLTVESQPGHGTQVTVLWEQSGQQEADETHATDTGDDRRRPRYGAQRLARDPQEHAGTGAGGRGAATGGRPSNAAASSGPTSS